MIFNEGIEKGIKKGIEKGIEKRDLDIVLNGFDNGYKISDIKIISGILEEKIIDLLRNNGRL